MEIQRTANAGVLLTMDGVRVLLDGLCDRVGNYLPTPKMLAAELLKNPPDILAFTHSHSDHYSDALVSEYRKRNLRPILGPESLYSEPIHLGNIAIRSVVSRHIGKAEPGLLHCSYILEGSRCVWFTGDAAPVQWRNGAELPKPDVLIAPYAYANTKVGWEITCSLTKNLVLLHLPNRQEDTCGLWQQVENTVTNNGETKVWIPQITEKIKIK